jgi:cob(I)alamin adenosyltransferase
VDELNSFVGLALAGGLPDEFRPWLERVQNDLFDLGADLSVPLEDERRERLRVTGEQVERLEELCDLVNERLEPLRSFVLPGGTEASARLHVARAVCRRAERLAVALAAEHGVNPAALAYLNRLSDLLFILARAANAGSPEPLWRPGGGNPSRRRRTALVFHAHKVRRAERGPGRGREGPGGLVRVEHKLASGARGLQGEGRGRA